MAVAVLLDTCRHTHNPEPRATLTIYNSLALKHLQVNQLLQRNQKTLVNAEHQASTQMEDLYYIPMATV